MSNEGKIIVDAHLYKDLLISEQQKEIDFLKDKLRELTDFYGEKDEWLYCGASEYVRIDPVDWEEFERSEISKILIGGKLARKIKKEVFGNE